MNFTLVYTCTCQTHKTFIYLDPIQSIISIPTFKTMLKSNSNIQYAFADPFYHRQYSHQHRWTQQAPQYYNKVGHRALSCYGF